jgi:streptogramin lyase
MVFDPTGNLYVSCWGTSTVCKINSSGTVTNVWSVGTSVWPAGIVLDAAGNVYTANERYGRTP